VHVSLLSFAVSAFALHSLTFYILAYDNDTDDDNEYSAYLLPAPAADADVGGGFAGSHAAERGQARCRQRSTAGAVAPGSAAWVRKAGFCVASLCCCS
jgi:hypothetical protein